MSCRQPSGLPQLLLNASCLRRSTQVAAAATNHNNSNNNNNNSNGSYSYSYHYCSIHSDNTQATSIRTTNSTAVTIGSSISRALIGSLSATGLGATHLLVSRRSISSTGNNSKNSTSTNSSSNSSNSDDGNMIPQQFGLHSLKEGTLKRNQNHMSNAFRNDEGNRMVGGQRETATARLADSSSKVHRFTAGPLTSTSPSLGAQNEEDENRLDSMTSQKALYASEENWRVAMQLANLSSRLMMDLDESSPEGNELTREESGDNEPDSIIHTNSNDNDDAATTTIPREFHRTFRFDSVEDAIESFCLSLGAGQLEHAQDVWDECTFESLQQFHSALHSKRDSSNMLSSSVVDSSLFFSDCRVEQKKCARRLGETVQELARIGDGQSLAYLLQLLHSSAESYKSVTSMNASLVPSPNSSTATLAHFLPFTQLRTVYTDALTALLLLPTSRVPLTEKLLHMKNFATSAICIQLADLSEAVHGRRSAAVLMNLVNNDRTDGNHNHHNSNHHNSNNKYNQHGWDTRSNSAEGNSIGTLPLRVQREYQRMVEGTSPLEPSLSLAKKIHSQEGSPSTIISSHQEQEEEKRGCEDKARAEISRPAVSQSSSPSSSSEDKNSSQLRLIAPELSVAFVHPAYYTPEMLLALPRTELDYVIQHSQWSNIADSILHDSFARLSEIKTIKTTTTPAALETSLNSREVKLKRSVPTLESLALLSMVPNSPNIRATTTATRAVDVEYMNNNSSSSPSGANHLRRNALIAALVKLEHASNRGRRECGKNNKSNKRNNIKKKRNNNNTELRSDGNNVEKVYSQPSSSSPQQKGIQNYSMNLMTWKKLLKQRLAYLQGKRRNNNSNNNSGSSRRGRVVNSVPSGIGGGPLPLSSHSSSFSTKILSPEELTLRQHFLHRLHSKDVLERHVASATLLQHPYLLMQLLLSPVRVFSVYALTFRTNTNNSNNNNNNNNNSNNAEINLSLNSAMTSAEGVAAAQLNVIASSLSIHPNKVKRMRRRWKGTRSAGLEGKEEEKERRVSAFYDSCCLAVNMLSSQKDYNSAARLAWNHLAQSVPPPYANINNGGKGKEYYQGHESDVTVCDEGKRNVYPSIFVRHALERQPQAFVASVQAMVWMLRHQAHLASPTAESAAQVKRTGELNRKDPVATAAHRSWMAYRSLDVLRCSGQTLVSPLECIQVGTAALDCGANFSSVKQTVQDLTPLTSTPSSSSSSVETSTPKIQTFFASDPHGSKQSVHESSQTIRTASSNGGSNSHPNTSEWTVDMIRVLSESQNITKWIPFVGSRNTIPTTATTTPTKHSTLSSSSSSSLSSRAMKSTVRDLLQRFRLTLPDARRGNRHAPNSSSSQYTDRVPVVLPSRSKILAWWRLLHGPYRCTNASLSQAVGKMILNADAREVFFKEATSPNTSTTTTTISTTAAVNTNRGNELNVALSRASNLPEKEKKENNSTSDNIVSDIHQNRRATLMSHAALSTGTSSFSTPLSSSSSSSESLQRQVNDLFTREVFASVAAGCTDEESFLTMLAILGTPNCTAVSHSEESGVDTEEGEWEDKDRESDIHKVIYTGNEYEYGTTNTSIIAGTKETSNGIESTSNDSPLKDSFFGEDERIKNISLKI